MKAAVWHGRGDVRVQYVPDPPLPLPGQLQVEVSWCGICGTDLHEYLAGPLYIPVANPHPLTGVQAPVVIGHEMSGRVTAVGEGCKGFAIGDRIAACPIIGCGVCRWCKSGSMAQCDRVAFLGTSWTGGALAEAVNLYAYQCYKLPDAITDEVGTLVEPFSAVVRAIHRNEPSAADRVAVVGTGPIGLMAILAARILGVEFVAAVEISARRIEAARQCGAREVINSGAEDVIGRSLDITNGQGFDLVVECAGQPATALLAAQMTRTRGKLTLMGVFDKPAMLDLTDIVFREKTITGSMSGYGLYEQSIQMMMDAQFRADVLITDHIDLEDLVDKGYQGLIEKKEQKIKTIVRTKVAIA